MAYRLRKDFPSLRFIRNRIAEGWATSQIAKSMGLTKRHVNRARKWPEYALAARLWPEDENLSDEFYPPLRDNPDASWAERRQVHQEKLDVQREAQRLQREVEEHTQRVIEENQRVYGPPGTPDWVIQQRQVEAARRERRQARGRAVLARQELKAAKRIVDHREEILRHFKRDGIEAYAQAWRLDPDEVDVVEHAARNFAYESITTEEISRFRGIYPGDVVGLEAPHLPWSKETQTAGQVFRNRAQARGYLNWIDYGIEATCRHFGAEVMSYLEALHLLKETPNE